VGALGEVEGTAGSTKVVSEAKQEAKMRCLISAGSWIRGDCGWRFCGGATGANIVEVVVEAEAEAEAEVVVEIERDSGAAISRDAVSYICAMSAYMLDSIAPCLG
jgi:hypothetical protein